MIQRASTKRLSAAIAAFAVASLMGAVSAHAEDKKPSRVFGKLTDAGGKPAANVQIKIAPEDEPKSSGGGGASGRKSIFQIPTWTNLANPAPIATVSTDQSGAYEFKTIPKGSYRVFAGARASGMAIDYVIVPGDGNAIELNMQLSAPKSGAVH